MTRATATKKGQRWNVTIKQDDIIVFERGSKKEDHYKFAGRHVHQDAPDEAAGVWTLSNSENVGSYHSTYRTVEVVRIETV